MPDITVRFLAYLLNLRSTILLKHLLFIGCSYPIYEINIWRQQVEIIDLMNIEDIDRIEKTIDSLAAKEPCKWEPVLVTTGAVKEEKEEGETAVSPELVAIEARVRSIEGDIKDLGKVQKVMAGMTSGLFQGFVIGFVITIVIFAVRRLV